MPTSCNPRNALIGTDRRMNAALDHCASKMRKAGFDMYAHPDEIGRNFRNRLGAMTERGKLKVEDVSLDRK